MEPAAYRGGGHLFTVIFFKRFIQPFSVNNPFEISVIIPMKIHNISKVQLAFYGKLHCDVLQYNM